MKKLSDTTKKKVMLKNYNVILILGLIYVLITLLAVISYVSRVSDLSTTMVTLTTVIDAVWWQILMIILFAVCYILYKRKTLFGTLLEITMALSMLVYIVISVATMGANLLAILVELVYPLILVFHGLVELKKLNTKVNNKKMRNRRSTI